MADIPKPTSNQNKGADRQSCRRAEWLIALFWVDRAKVPDEWLPQQSSDSVADALEVLLCRPSQDDVLAVAEGVKNAARQLRTTLESIPCTVPGCEYCGRPQTRGVAGNTHRDAMDQTFELDGQQFRVIVQEQIGVHWLPASVNDFTSEQLAEWLEEMARRVREGGQ